MFERYVIGRSTTSQPCLFSHNKMENQLVVLISLHIGKQKNLQCNHAPWLLGLHYQTVQCEM